MHDEVWRIEVYFRNHNKPVGFATNMGKRDTYEQLSAWLASENTERVLVFRNGVLYQTITVETANQPDDKTTE